VEEALEGNSYAQLRLGDCFFNGVGVNVDYQKAAFWYEKVAEEYESVQYNLGVCYYSEQDYEKARLWFEQSAEQGCAKAQFELGRCYEKGKGVIANREKSLYWYTKSA
jgi:TPR repeat protein